MLGFENKMAVSSSKNWGSSVNMAFFQVEFQGEEGTGLGPTLEFYALVAAEFQRTSLGIWLCDDDFPDDESRQVSSHLCSFLKILHVRCWI